MLRLQDRFQLIAPDLRGFGDCDKPPSPFGPERHAADMLALIDAPRLERVGVVVHDVGGAAMQAPARKAPDRLVGGVFLRLRLSGHRCAHTVPRPRSTASSRGLAPERSQSPLLSSRGWKRGATEP